ncbi:MAG: hypothetical protein B7Y99_12655 [Caulobacterales bacterium 32-69-10]|nr:MAG: hypothetical protein B7Y99_12655 [Caulobacterales bacterium 32-69-10]
MTDSVPAPIFQLVYVSDVSPVAALTLEATMHEILLVSHRRNGADRITGLLISNGAWFVQMLEGEENAVRACYARIEADVRHAAPTVRLLRPVAERQYSRWSMCGLTLSSLEDQLLGAPDIALDIRQMASGALTAMLKRVAHRYGAELDSLHASLGAEVAATRDWAQGGGPPRWA